MAGSNKNLSEKNFFLLSPTRTEIHTHTHSFFLSLFYENDDDDDDDGDIWMKTQKDNNNK